MPRKTRCDLRVMVRFDDGAYCGYAINGITKASRLREELENAASVLTDQGVTEDCAPADAWHPSVPEMFDHVYSPLAMGVVEADDAA